MAFWNKKVSEKGSVVNLDYKPSLSDDFLKLSEQFKGEVEKKDVKFPQELGEEHPFDFKLTEGLYQKYGLVSAIVDKYVDFVVGPGFYITCDDERAKTIIEEFMKDVNFDSLLRAWCKEALKKGNGFFEIGGSKEKGVEGLKVLNANYMYVLRDKKGKVLGYRQYKGAFDKFSKEKVIDFNVDNVAHVGFNINGDCAYGLGIIFPAMKLIDDLLQNTKDMHQIYNRKANSPLHAKLGKVEGDTKIIPKPEDVAAFGTKMETMSNKTDWATDPLVDLSVVDFGNIGEKFSSVLEYDLDMLVYAFQMPFVLLGKANIPEGIAKVQMEAFQRRIQSIQAELEKIIEEKIFKRILRANGLDVHVEFEWGTPSVMEVEGRLALISELVKSPTTGMAMRNILEEELINLLKLDKDEFEKLKLEQEKQEEEERKRLEAQPQPLVPGQNKGFPKKPLPKAQQPKQPKPTKEEFEIVESKDDTDIKNLQLQNAIFALLLSKLGSNEKEGIGEKEEVVEQQTNNMDIIKSILEEQEKIRKEQMEEQEKRRKEELDMLKQIMVQAIESKPKENDNIKQEIEEIKNKLNKTKIVKQKVFSRKSLIPNFRVSNNGETKTQMIEKEDIKKEEIKKEKINNKTRELKNYEIEKECKHCEESWNDIDDIKEWLGFNYKDYLGEILKVLGLYEFGQLKAVNEKELEAGYLSNEQVDKLKGVLKNGFEEGQGLKDIAKEVDKKVGIKDLYRMTEDGNIKTGVSGLPILARSADKRAIGIVRSEVTRLANAGAEEYFKQNGINKVGWVASYGDRTCPDCEALNGQIFNIGEHPSIPLHPLCRCTLKPIVEVK